MGGRVGVWAGAKACAKRALTKLTSVSV